MLNRLLEYNYSAICIFIFAIVIKFALYFTGLVDSASYSFSLFNINITPLLFSGILSALSTVILGILILVNSERHAKRRDFSLWIVLIFTLQLSFNTFFAFSVEYIGVLFFVLSLFFFSKNINSVEQRHGVLDCFNLTFSLAIGTLFTPHLLFTLPLFWISRLLINQSSFKSFLASSLGYILPFLIIDSIIFSFYPEEYNYTHQEVFAQIRIHLHSNEEPYQWSWTQLSNIGPLVLLLLSLYTTFAKAHTLKTITRKFNLFNLIILIYITLAMTFDLIPRHFSMMLIFVPTAYFYANFQSQTRRHWRNVFLWVLIISAFLSYPETIERFISLYQLVF